jgi:hypothetical protein
MRQEVNDTMGEHTDKQGHHRFVEHRGQGEAGTDNDKRMQTDGYSMQRRMMQECMEFRSHGRVRQVFQVMRNKAQG